MSPLQLNAWQAVLSMAMWCEKRHFYGQPKLLTSKQVLRQQTHDPSICALTNPTFIFLDNFQQFHLTDQLTDKPR